jgi:hypothetical protein
MFFSLGSTIMSPGELAGAQNSQQHPQKQAREKRVLSTAVPLYVGALDCNELAKGVSYLPSGLYESRMIHPSPREGFTACPEGRYGASLAA